MHRIRVGVVGLGRFGRLHAETLQSLPQAELVALCDTRPDILAEVAFSLAAPYHTTSYEAMLAEAELDAVHIVTPDALHAIMVEAALERGLHVFVEKPLALTFREAAKLAALARKKGLQLQVGFILRYELRHAHLKEQILAGRFGRLATLRLKRHASRTWFYQYGHTVHPMLESTIHDIDLALWYVAAPCTRVYAVDRSFLDYGGPDTSIAILEFENGSVALIDASWLVPDGAPQTTLELGGTIDASLEIVGAKATAKLDFLNSGFSIWTDEGVAHPELSAWPRVMGSIQGALRMEIADFVQCVRENRPSKIASLDDAVSGLAIVEAIQQSAHTQQPVHVALGAWG
ncbi:MAG: Gfo/Idh/MocA family oxidoreductase [Chloroflexi bacterium]|nr:Gfo/Idh/MocA family oxidoreductase [Chloroflexota bacterium]